jgi:cyanophycinase
MTEKIFMNGLIALLGSGEYLPVMNEVDAYLLANSGANGRKPRVVCLPTAAGQEGPKSVGRWSNMGVEHFTKLGADVQAVPVTDKETANDLNQTLKGSLVWESAQKAWARGAAYAGCSAGAMVLGKEMPDFRAAGIRSTSAFGILPIASLLPHFNNMPLFGKPLVATLRRRLRDDEVMIGVDENTAIIGSLNNEWLVMGEAKAHLFTNKDGKSYAAGEKFTLGI